jgi:hypothetical protein
MRERERLDSEPTTLAEAQAARERLENWCLVGGTHVQLLPDRMQQDCMQCSPAQSHGRSQRLDATDEPVQARSISPSNPALEGTL